MTSVQTITILFGTLLIGVLLFRRVRGEKLKTLARQQQLFREVVPLFDNATSNPGDAAGIWKITGTYREAPFQFTTIIDTLATRKLPSLWLQVTLPRAQPIPATLDMMMRPNGPTTFSNFDFLSETLATPVGLPEHCVLRSDDAKAAYPFTDVLRGHVKLFTTPKGKELLVSPKGLRIVLQLAESDRLRYGVFRQADFGDVKIDRDLARQAMDTLLALEEDLKEHLSHG
jgi:hypothetical protein